MEIGLFMQFLANMPRSLPEGAWKSEGGSSCLIWPLPSPFQTMLKLTLFPRPCLFILLSVSLDVRKLFNLMLYNLLIFAFVTCYLISYPKSHYQHQEDSPLCFLLGVLLMFQILCLSL